MARSLDWPTLSRLSPLLDALPDRARRASRLLEVASGQNLFVRGDTPQAMLFVLAGEVRLVRQSQAGGEIVLQRARRGFFAEASLDQQAYRCDAVAVAASEMVAIPRRAFADALADERFRRQWMAHLARELRIARAHSERLNLKTARERIIHFIEVEGESGSLTLTETKKDWAAGLGLTHEALYRALAQMQNEGRLTVSGATMRLLR